MPESDLLLTLAEVSVAFAGFASIVVLFKRRDSGLWRAEDAFRFGIMLEYSLAALFFAVAPVLLGYFEVGRPGVWAASSAALGLFIVVEAPRGWWSARRLARAGRLNWALNTFIGVLALSSVVALLLNVIEVGFHGEGGPYVAGVCVLLLGAGINFYRLVGVSPGEVADE